MRQPRVALQATALSLFLLCLPVTTSAQVAVDSQLWLQAVATVNLSEDWRLHLEEQPRWDDDATQQFQVITRFAVGRRVTNRISVWAGHAWVHKMRDGQTALENRLWQQFLATLPPVGGWAPTVRVRTEQRFQDGWIGTSHRIRAMARLARPVATENPWSIVFWGESFAAFNDTEGGPPKGWDQHRVFGGVNHRFGPRANLDAGYLHVVARRRDATAVSTPGALLTLNLTF